MVEVDGDGDPNNANDSPTPTGDNDDDYFDVEGIKGCKVMVLLGLLNTVMRELRLRCASK
jgi:hypothetical protein